MGRQAKNEAVFRAVSREIAHASEQLGQRELEVLCECGRGGCEELLAVTTDVYDRAHKQSDRFLVAPGHENHQIERVVEAASGYVVVDSSGKPRTWWSGKTRAVIRVGPTRQRQLSSSPAALTTREPQPA